MPIREVRGPDGRMRVEWFLPPIFPIEDDRPVHDDAPVEVPVARDEDWLPNPNDPPVPEPLPPAEEPRVMVGNGLGMNAGRVADAWRAGWEDVDWDPFRRGGMKKKAEKMRPEGKTGAELFQLILSGIREVYDVEGTIAGGAVRDLAAGVSYHKDVDVWLPMTMDAFQERYDELGWMGEFRPEKIKKKYAESNSTDRGYSLVQHVPIDIIFLKEPLSPKDVDAFPVHAQRCVWTLGEGLTVSPAAKKDIENKTFTIDDRYKTKEQIETYLEKIKGWKSRDGYKDWTAIQPVVKEWWEE